MYRSFQTKQKLVNSPCVIIIRTIVHVTSANICNNIWIISTIEEPNMSIRLALEEILAAEPEWGDPAPLGPGATGSEGDIRLDLFP